MEKDNKAESAYKDYKKGMKYKDIATKYNVSLNTVKSWKQRKWNDIENGVQPKKKSVHTKCILKQNKNAPPIKELLPEEMETLANEELTEKQRLFCLYYTKWFNATKAYQKAYDCDYFTALANGPRLLGNARIKAEIQRIKDAKIKQSMYSAEDLFQKMMAIAYCDVTDYMEFGTETIATEIGDLKVNRAYFKDSTEIDGTLIQEVKQGKDGASVKLISKEFALKWLDKHFGTLTKLQQAQLAQMQAQTDKLKSDADNTPDDSVQNKMDAIDGILAQMQPITDEDV